MAKTKILNLQPAPGYILVKPLEAQKKTASGIVLPDSHEEKPQKGKVIAVGGEEISDAGLKRKSPAKKKEVVYYKKWGGNEVEVEGIEYLFLRFEDILAVEK